MKRSAAKKMKQRSAGKPDIELGKRIRLRRVEQKISQAELGDKLGVSFQQVQKYEKGVNRVGAARLQQIATALDVPVTFFYDGDGKAREVESLLFLDSAFSLRSAARLQQDQGPDRAASAGVLDGIDRRERRLMVADRSRDCIRFDCRPYGLARAREHDRSAPADRPATYRRARPRAGPAATTPGAAVIDGSAGSCHRALLDIEHPQRHAPGARRGLERRDIDRGIEPQQRELRPIAS